MRRSGELSGEQENGRHRRKETRRPFLGRPFLGKPRNRFGNRLRKHRFGNCFQGRLPGMVMSRTGPIEVDALSCIGQNARAFELQIAVDAIAFVVEQHVPLGVEAKVTLVQLNREAPRVSGAHYFAGAEDFGRVRCAVSRSVLRPICAPFRVAVTVTSQSPAIDTIATPL